MLPGPERADALGQLGWLHKDDAAATVLLEQALAEAGDDPARRARLHMSYSDICAIRGNQPRALAEARLALARAERAGDQLIVAAMIAQVFEFAVLAGVDPDERELERAIELERQSAGQPLMMSPSRVAGVHHLQQGRLEKAEEELRWVLARAEDEGQEHVRADALPRLARIALRRGDVAAAAALATDALAIAEQLDMPRPTCAAIWACGTVAL
jgi:tetratricopeptide (TPR) repeat protein